ncbi:murein L,D-transpeptidase catalytic domain family protein [Roseivirga sp. BDSF3-8]|uniref:murein L,D-transpeptidase catalytic domain family protein n=1 Tax=Roseivirga sp. BDSF3-8 TaxID=3241598 RepID=UPI0035321CE4
MKTLLPLFFVLAGAFAACNDQKEQSSDKNLLEAEAERLEEEYETALHKDIPAADSTSYVMDSLKDFPIKKSIELRLNAATFEDSLQSIYRRLNLDSANLPYDVFRMGMIGHYNLRMEGALGDRDILTLIDFTQSSCDKRFYTLDLDSMKILFNTYVAHGRNSGGNFASSFSNLSGSNQSSLGFFVTAETYTGSKGYSMRLDGQEAGINDKVRERAVVMHEAKYVSEDWISKYGRLGRSLGCPALPEGISRTVIDSIKNGTTLFAYYNDSTYLNASRYLDLDQLMRGGEIVEEVATPLLNPIN